MKSTPLSNLIAYVQSKEIEQGLDLSKLENLVDAVSRSKTYVVVADIENNDRRDIENLDGAAFNSTDEAIAAFDSTGEGSFIIPLEDFTGLLNDEQFNDGGSWIAYITINNA